MSVKICAIVAMSKNRCIGLKNDLPWHIPADLKHFKEKTSGKPIIMGRKTFQSIVDRIGKPLPKRRTYIISRTGFSYDHPDVHHVPSLEEALERTKTYTSDHGIDEIIIGGGAQIYGAALPFLDKIYLTEIDAHIDGDAFFPDLPQNEWIETARDHHAGDPSYAFLELNRLSS